jgi:hypothetical protein
MEIEFAEGRNTPEMDREYIWVCTHLGLLNEFVPNPHSAKAVDDYARKLHKAINAGKSDAIYRWFARTGLLTMEADTMSIAGFRFAPGFPIEKIEPHKKSLARLIPIALKMKQDGGTVTRDVRVMTKKEIADGRKVRGPGHKGGAGHGLFDGKTLAINPNMSGVDILTNIVHELLHSLRPDDDEVTTDRQTEKVLRLLAGETVAEAVDPPFGNPTSGDTSVAGYTPPETLSRSAAMQQARTKAKITGHPVFVYSTDGGFHISQTAPTTQGTVQKVLPSGRTKRALPVAPAKES